MRRSLLDCLEQSQSMSTLLLLLLKSVQVLTAPEAMSLASLELPKQALEGLQTSWSLWLQMEMPLAKTSWKGGKPKSLATMIQASMQAKKLQKPFRPQPCRNSFRVTKWSSLERGIRVMIPISASSQAKEIAGIRSVPRSMHSTSTVEMGGGIWMMSSSTKGKISVVWLEAMYMMAFLRLSKILRPSSMPRMMLLKSSLSSTIEAASLATSVPAIPIAIPRSAFLMAGESLTPSPVTATISPSLWQAFTMMSFWAGLVLAKTTSFLESHFSSFLPCSTSGSPSSSKVIWVISSPWTTMASERVQASSKLIFSLRMIQSTVTFSLMMLHSLAMAAAVTGWSPVTMITFTPAVWHLITEKGTDSLGGSLSERMPTKHCSQRGKLGLITSSMLKSQCSVYLSRGRCSLAKPSTLCPWLPKKSLVSWNFLSHSSFFSTGCPSMSMWVHIFQTFSGAPLVKRQRSESLVGYWLTEKANLLTELKSSLTSLSSLFLMMGKRSLVNLMSSMAWKNLMRADSEASPMVGMSSQSILLIFSFQSSRNSFSLPSFSRSVRCLSWLMRSCSNQGGEGSKMATEQTTAHSCRALKPLLLVSYSKGQVGSSFCLLAALKTLPSYMMLAAIILFMVRVPVLSEQMQVVQPRVSTACRFLASTFLFDSRLAVRVSEMVTSSSRPLGTLATVIPMARVRALMTQNPMPRPTDSTMMPISTAAIPRRWTKRLISLLRGVSSSSALMARPAIWPMKVRSPVNMHTPFPLPELLRVEKKATFLVQSGLSGLVHQTVLDSSSVSPVRLELSTFIPFDQTMRMSAGIFLPWSILTKSPRTSLTEEMDFQMPSRITVISGGMKFLKDSMRALLFLFCMNSMKVETFTITVITMPKQRLLGSSEASPQATKQRMAPAHIRNAKKLAMWCRYSTKGFMPSFSVSLFSPSSMSRWEATASVRPFLRSVPYLLENSSREMRWSSIFLNFSASSMDLFMVFSSLTSVWNFSLSFCLRLAMRWCRFLIFSFSFSSQSCRSCFTFRNQDTSSLLVFEVIKIQIIAQLLTHPQISYNNPPTHSIAIDRSHRLSHSVPFAHLRLTYFFRQTHICRELADGDVRISGPTCQKHLN